MLLALRPVPGSCRQVLARRLVAPRTATPRPHYRGGVETPAVRSRRIRWAVICIAVLVLAADQVSKALAVAAAPSGSPGGLVRAGLVRNTGASFGIGTGHPVLITVVAAAVLAAAVTWLARTRRPGAALCLAAVAGGAAGNLADRLLRSPGPGRGAVVDWIHVAGYPPAFNLADVAIRAGAVGALVVMLTGDRRKTRRMATQGRRFPGWRTP
jgi:signal peptidase II